MRRTPITAVLTVVLLTVTALLVPATAHADVTEANLSVAFDRFSTDRVAAITLEARSESGITAAEAVVEHSPEEGVWTPIATVPLTLSGLVPVSGEWVAARVASSETKMVGNAYTTGRPGRMRGAVNRRTAGQVTQT